MDIQKATVIRLSAEEQAVLEGMVGSSKTEQRMAERARIVLLAAKGKATRAIARELGCANVTVSKWRVRFAAERLAGLGDQPRPGPRPRYTEATGRRILAALEQPSPAGFARWTAPLLAAELGDVSDQYIWRFLRAQRIDLEGRKCWCINDDPEFVAKSADIVGLYLDPPDGAVVPAVDEKPHIQALERAQGYLRLPGGRALTGHSHDYKRHGTTTLFAALDVASGAIRAGHYKRRRRVEFLDFMNKVVAEHPGKEIHVVLDNLNTHKPRRDRWLARHPNVRFHFTPTHASWLNQVEIWFSILNRAALAGASFTSPRELREAINDFIAHYNQAPKPFAWRKPIVHQKTLESRFAHL